jgi:hypothetical protein
MEPPRVSIGGNNGWPATEQAGPADSRSSTGAAGAAAADSGTGDRVSMRRQRRKKSS